MMFESYSKETDDAKLILGDRCALTDVNSSLASSVKDLHVQDELDSVETTAQDNSTSRESEEHVVLSESEPPVIIGDNLSPSETVLGEISARKDETELGEVKRSEEALEDNFEAEGTECVNQVLLASVNSFEKSISEVGSDQSILESSECTVAAGAFNMSILPLSNVDECDNLPNVEDSEDYPKLVLSKTEHPSGNNLSQETDLGLAIEKTVEKDSSVYPEDLNPFADEAASGTNPFGSDSDEEKPASGKVEDNMSLSSPRGLNPFGSDSEEEEEHKKPVPLPRRTLTPEPSPMPRTRLRSSGRSIGSVTSLARKKKPAPPPPPSPAPTISYPSTPRIRKARRAPLPPGLNTPSSAESTPSKREALKASDICERLRIYEMDDHNLNDRDSTTTEPKVPSNTVESATPEAKEDMRNVNLEEVVEKLEAKNAEMKSEESPASTRRLIIPLARTESVGSLSPSLMEGSLRSASPDSSVIGDASYQDDLPSPFSEKRHKDSANLFMKTTDKGNSYQRNKSTYGQWKRKKGPAPSVPFPEKRPMQPIPLLKLKQELEDIEVKQQGLERQGVSLEKKIREKFNSESSVTPYVEDLVLQLFELVNEKNDLFRRQAELMYLRRQYQLEEEHAELEFQIRCLMARPEANKTDSDKEMEELLIQRLVEVVERRDAIVQCLERDRLREAEEDKGVTAQLNKFTEAMGVETLLSRLHKKPKKAKKDKHKESHSTYKTVDLDKDLDESEKEHKKKKKWYTLPHHLKEKH